MASGEMEFFLEQILEELQEVNRRLIVIEQHVIHVHAKHYHNTVEVRSLVNEQGAGI